MLNPEPMVRLRAVILERDGRKVLQALGERGLLHLIHAEAGPDTAPLEPPVLQPVWDHLLERAARLRAALGVPAIETMALDITPLLERASEAQALEAQLGEMEERAEGLLHRREAQLRQREELAASLDRLHDYLGLGISLDRIGAGAFLYLQIGTLPEEGLARLRRSLGDRGLLLMLPSRARRCPWVLLGAAGDEAVLEALLREAGFQRESLPGRGTLDAWIEGLQRELAETTAELAGLEAQLRAFAAEAAGPLTALEAAIHRERNLLAARGHCPRTETTFLLQGWMPAKDASAVEERLRRATGGHDLMEIRPPERDEADHVPVLLRPSPLLRPFGQLVAGYGFPKYQELSPTPFVALSYLLMFGMMFGDAGHGAILALGGLAALLAHKRDLGVLLVGGGLSSALFGAIYGSCFGLARFKPWALWRDPLEGDPLQLMALAMGFGILLISLGLMLNILNRIRRHEVLGALLDRFGLAGLVFYWGALALLLWRGPRPSALPVVLALCVLAWLLREPLEQRLLRRAGHVSAHAPEGGAGFTGALVEAFETLLVYLANTISFVRLAAYAMSHAALLVATFMVAQAVARPDGAAGLASWLVIVAGNLVAILLEGVIASVQALRLEYYEFFGKFFSGAGRPFEPFRLDAKGGAV
ncbi:MAG TPA: V-type ATPase 116kDa subunit family protein [Holophaga sp.]|mgnify:CR=1 FL=1|nr:V-type ATPase 116kDa subunit family protein [Holophaga sp.]